METKEFYAKVAEMRKMQKEYFKKRDVIVLKKAKELEREVDAEIERYNNKQLTMQL